MPAPLTFDQRLLAQAVRSLEEAEGLCATAEPLEKLLAGSELGLEHRIVERADQLEAAPPLRAALDRLRGRVRWLLAIALILMLLLGALAVTQTFVRSPDGTVNFFWLLLSLLGLNSLTMLIWLAAMLLRPAVAQANSIAAGVFSLLRRYLPFGADPHAMAAWLRVYTGEPQFRWLLGTLVQAVWVAYLLGGLLMVVLQLLTRQFDFVWETTLLGDRAFVALTSWLASLPAFFGFDGLDTALISASRPGADAEVLAAARSQWAALLLASLVCYGLLPRLLLLLFCFWRLRRARFGYRLDLFEPYFISLQQRLHPVSRHLGVVDADDFPPGRSDEAVNARVFMPPADRRVAWLGLDLPEEERCWPPASYAEPELLGVASDRVSRDMAAQLVRKLNGEVLVLEALLTCSPARGIGQYLKHLLDRRDPANTWLALSGRQRLTGQLTAADVQQRIWDWHRLAGEAGIAADHIIHLDSPAPGGAGLL